jgi:hypothetical protein
MEGLTVLNKEERDRDAYERRLMLQRDRDSFRRDARLAYEGGFVLGFEQGYLLSQVRLCQKLLKQPQTPEEDLLRLSLEELTALHAQLMKQAFPNDDGIGPRFSLAFIVRLL